MLKLKHRVHSIGSKRQCIVYYLQCYQRLERLTDVLQSARSIRAKFNANTKNNVSCDHCGIKLEDALEISTIKIGKKQINVCELCNSQLLNTTLKIETTINGRTKTKADLIKINKRKKAK